MTTLDRMDRALAVGAESLFWSGLSLKFLWVGVILCWAAYLLAAIGGTGWWRCLVFPLIVGAPLFVLGLFMSLHSSRLWRRHLRIWSGEEA